MTVSMDDERQTPYEISPTTLFTVFTLGDAAEQSVTLDEFLSIWSGFPPEGGEHLADALWSIEYGEDSMVVSIVEVSP